MARSKLCRATDEFGGLTEERDHRTDASFWFLIHHKAQVPPLLQSLHHIAQEVLAVGPEDLGVAAAAETIEHLGKFGQLGRFGQGHKCFAAGQGHGAGDEFPTAVMSGYDNHPFARRRDTLDFLAQVVEAHEGDEITARELMLESFQRHESLGSKDLTLKQGGKNALRREMVDAIDVLGDECGIAF